MTVRNEAHGVKRLLQQLDVCATVVAAHSLRTCPQEAVCEYSPQVDSARGLQEISAI